MSVGNDGKWFEQMIENSVKELRRKYPGSMPYFHRVPDSYEAMGHVPPQPADFYIASRQAGVRLIEAKSSDVHSSLSSCASKAITSGQAKAQLDWALAGQKGLFLFCGDLGQLEIWNGAYVADRRLAGQRLQRSAEKAQYISSGVGTLTSLLEKIFLK